MADTTSLNEKYFPYRFEQDEDGILRVARVDMNPAGGPRMSNPENRPVTSSSTISLPRPLAGDRRRQQCDRGDLHRGW